MANTNALWQLATYHLPAIISYLLSISHTKKEKKKKKPYSSRKMFTNFHEKKKAGKWTINRKFTRQKEQED